MCQYPVPTGGSVRPECVVARAAAIPANAATNVIGMKRVRKRFKTESCWAGAVVLKGVDLSDITWLAAEKSRLGERPVPLAGGRQPAHVLPEPDRSVDSVVEVFQRELFVGSMQVVVG